MCKCHPIKSCYCQSISMTKVIIRQIIASFQSKLRKVKESNKLRNHNHHGLQPVCRREQLAADLVRIPDTPPSWRGMDRHREAKFIMDGISKKLIKDGIHSTIRVNFPRISEFLATTLLVISRSADFVSC